MIEFVFGPPLRLARDVTVRTLNDAADFARTYVGPRLPRRRDRLVRRLEEISDDARARIAARAFRAWAIAEGLLAVETERRLSEVALEPRSIKRGSPCGQCVVAQFHHAVVPFVRADRTYAALIMQSRPLSTIMGIPQMALPLFVR